jgi:hypothetical protein
MGEVINKEYLTRDDLLAMRSEIDVQAQRISELEGQVSAHGKLISSLMAETALTVEDHHVRISELENELAPTNMRQV